MLNIINPSVQISSVAQLCPTLCDPMNRSTPGLPVRHQLPEFIQTHVHRVSDDIQPSHPLLSLSLSARNPSQHQSLFQCVNSLRLHELQHARPLCASQLSESTQTYVHQVGDAIQPSHPLSSPSPPAPNPSQHQSLFQSVIS